MMKKIFFISLFFLAGLFLFAQTELELDPGMYAVIKTNKGEMTFKLDYINTPLTVANFAGLAEGEIANSAKNNEPFYDGLLFYKNIPNYAIFSGDPLNNGKGGPGYTLPREKGFILSAGNPGTLIMSGLPDEENGSRFFIIRRGDAYLDNKYTPFGEMISGAPVLEKLGEGDMITSVSIIRIGEEAENVRFDQDLIAKYIREAREKELEEIRRANPTLAKQIESLGEERTKTTSGIYFNIMKEGTGDKIRIGQTLSVHYAGYLLDGTKFDSSYDRGQAFTFVIGEQGMIMGWLEMLLDMKPGEKRKVIIPPALAYGDQAFGPISANSWLVFDIEIVEVK